MGMNSACVGTEVVASWASEVVVVEVALDCNVQNASEESRVYVKKLSLHWRSSWKLIRAV